MITYPDRLVPIYDHGYDDAAACQCEMGVHSVACRIHPTPPPVVSEASKRLWAQLAAHLERCERPIAECGPCSDAYGLESY